jgi:hypothetical protein
MPPRQMPSIVYGTAWHVGARFPPMLRSTDRPPLAVSKLMEPSGRRSGLPHLSRRLSRRVSGGSTRLVSRRWVGNRAETAAYGYGSPSVALQVGSGLCDIDMG